MTNQLSNSFVDERRQKLRHLFIGRRSHIAMIQSRFVHPRPAKGIAIVGISQIGKNSLAQHAIMQQRQALIANGILPIRINLGAYEHATEFFRSLIEDCYQGLEDQGWLTDPIKKAAKRLLEDQAASHINHTVIKRFFQQIGLTGHYIVCVLSGFDYACILFKDSIADFQRLRDLSTEPDLGITFVTISRRFLRDIEVQTAGISKLDLIFEKCYVGMLEASELDEFFAQFAVGGEKFSEDMRRQFLYYCGRHPYLLSLVGCRMIELLGDDFPIANKPPNQFWHWLKGLFKNRERTPSLISNTELKIGQQPIDYEALVKKVFGECKKDLLDYYERLINDLKRDDYLDATIRVLSGDTTNVESSKINSLVAYGIIETSEDGTAYKAFSAYFQEYLLTKIIEVIGGPLSTGYVLRDQYEIQEIISTPHTSNSFVYKAIDLNVANRKVAVKEPLFFYGRKSMSEENFQREWDRYRREVNIITKIDHAYIGKVHNFIDDRYMVQEWIKGRSLRSIINAKAYESIAKVRQIGIEACQAFAYILRSEQIIHRDIKPDNIFLGEDGHIRIIDFGLAQTPELKTMNYPLSFPEQQSPGTPEYMSPEQARGAADHCSDIFSLGMTLYELLTLKRAYPRGAWNPNFHTHGTIPPPTPICELRPEAPPALAACILKAISLAPGDRYATWEEFEQALEAV